MTEQHDGELVAAEPRDGVAPRERLRPAAAQLLQQRIADGMTERVVDFLEMVEVETEHRELVVALGKVQRPLQPLAEQRAVRQIGQRIMARHVEDLLLRLFPFGDVLEGRNPAAALHGLVDDADRAVGARDDPCHGLTGSHARESDR